MWSCVRYRSRLGPYLDGELNERQRKAVAAHVAKCAPCRTALEEMRGLESILHSFNIPAEPPDLTTRILSAARARHQTTAIRLKPHRPRNELLWDWALKSATVAALLIGIVTGSFLGWRVGRDEGRSVRADQEVYALDAFSGTPNGSIEAVTLALLEGAK
ncbi:MAG: hypothetical protein C4519_27225 [Desulfobacteraceae bacterium]|nr:MAG: hypothetical protein C4519_27225 [Desulfobacteraceae bacterium]